MNEIIFVVPRIIYSQNPIKIDRNLYIVDNEVNVVRLGWVEDRKLFDTNGELIHFLIPNYDPDKRKDNLIFDLQAEAIRAKKKIQKKE